MSTDHLASARTSSEQHCTVVGDTVAMQESDKPKARRILACIGPQRCDLEIVKKFALIDGNTFPEMVIDGRAVTGDAPPEILVNHCDKDVALVEIEWALDNGIVLHRHIMLSMEDGYAWIGDVVRSPQESAIEYRCCWPLADGVTSMPESETTEGYLVFEQSIRSLVIAPAIGEWRSDHRSAGSLEFGNDRLTLTQSRRGRNLYAPLFVQLGANKACRKRTWRQLTVAENLENVDADHAVAFRVQVGKTQIVMYRSLSHDGPRMPNRTFFGQNVISELYLGRLEKNRSMTELLQVE